MKIKADAFIGAKPEEVLKSVFGYDSFRPYQKEIITEVLKGHDTLAIMPTGGGKSICYQIPALIMKGITVVVSPLISLMQDQVSSLESQGVPSVFLNSTLSWEEYKQAVSDIRNNKVKIVYISPEGLSTERIRDLLSEPEVQVSCITIDESHCISQWGPDFRPDYLEIATIRRYVPDAVLLALTATATQEVQSDIAKNLKLKKPSIFVSSFDRSNIYLEVQPKRKATDQVINFIRKHSGDSGIIYCFSRRQVDELTETLDKLGYSVLNYHAGLSDAVRAKNQELFIKDEVQIMIATVAFGMGIDKPNVRFVINYDLPKSVEEYYQEIGRAGRDGLPAWALLLYSASDMHKIRYFFNEASTPEQSELLLQGMIKFATGRTCRRKSLLAYFGEKYLKNEIDSENCCDICSNGEVPVINVTTPFQKLLSCIYRTKERFGASYIIDILTGSRNRRIMDNGHNMISTWNIGHEYSKEEWIDFVNLLISENYLVKEPEYGVIKITYAGRSALTNRDTIMLPFAPIMKNSKEFTTEQKTSAPEYIVHKKSEKIIAEKPQETDEAAQGIIEALKKWRKRKADDMNVPPYVIFNDKTLMDIAAKKPSNKTELLNIYGLGTVKVENFGKSILNTIEEFCNK